MTDIQVLLTDLSELTTRYIVKNERPKGLEENLSIAKRGGNVSLMAKNYYEKETGKKAVTCKNAMGIIYSNNNLLDK